MARLDLVIRDHQNLGRNLSYGFCPVSRRALFPSDLGALWMRRIDHLSDRSQSPQLLDKHRQKPVQGQPQFIRAFSFSG